MLIILLYLIAVILFINRRRPGAPRGPRAPQQRTGRHMGGANARDYRDDAPARHDEFYLVSSNLSVFDGAGGCGGGSDW